MKSGLKDRNNVITCPEEQHHTYTVSMKSGLKDRNNKATGTKLLPRTPGLNEVRPERPEQFRLL